jgi:HK97 family phage portal protein
MTTPFNPADPRNVVDPSRKDSLATWQAFFGMLEQSTDRYTTRSDWAKAPADEAFVFAAVRLRSLAATQPALRVYVKEGHDLVPSDLTTDQSAKELQHLLDFVNPDSMSSSDLKATLLASVSVYGEAYLVKTRGRLGGRPQELHFLNPASVAPVMGEHWIDGYEYRPTGTNKSATYLPKDVIPFRTPGNFVDPTRGLSPMSAIRNEISTSRMAGEHTNNQLRNHGVPAGVWVVPKDTEVTPQDQSAIRRVLASLRGPRNAGKTAVLPGGLTWQNLGLPEADAQYLNARKISRMAIGAAFGIPLALLGDDEKTAVYRSIRDAEEIFWRRFSSELNWVASVFDSWLTPEFDPTGDRLTIRFDLSGIEALRPSLQEQTSLWQSLLDRGVVTPNEARTHFGVGLPTEWGNKPILTNQVSVQPEVGATPQVAEPLPVQEPEDGEEVQPLASLVIPADLYKHPAVRAFVAGAPLDATALLGGETSTKQAEALEVGIRRRYTPQQISEGVPSEGFLGLAGETL